MQPLLVSEKWVRRSSFIFRASRGRKATVVRMTDIFDVLSDESRRLILTILLSQESRHNEVSVSHLVTATGLPQPTVSKQLKVLRDAHLVTVREDGQHRLYRLNTAPLRSVDSWLAQFRDGEATTPAFLLRAARELGRGLADLAGKAPWR